MSDKKRSVLVVEDDLSIARSIQASLVSEGFAVFTPVRSARMAIEHARLQKPDVIVMDIGLAGDTDGIDASKQIGRERWTPIVYVGARSDSMTILRAAGAYGVGYVVKPFVDRQLIAAVRMAASLGAEYDRISLSAVERIEDRVRKALEDIRRERGWAFLSSDSSSKTACLTPRELEVARLLAAGERVATIARSLGLSIYTVRNHLRSVFRKLDLHAQDELIEYWRRVTSPLKWVGPGTGD